MITASHREVGVATGVSVNRRPSRFGRVLAALVLAVGASIATSGTAQPASAEPTCQGSDYFSTWSGKYDAWYPTVRSGTWDTYRQLSKGDTGDGVRVLQAAMNYCYSTGLVVDGIFGQKTVAAIRKVWAEETIGPLDYYDPWIQAKMDWPNWHYASGSWHYDCIDNG